MKPLQPHEVSWVIEQYMLNGLHTPQKQEELTKPKKSDTWVWPTFDQIKKSK